MWLLEELAASFEQAQRPWALCDITAIEMHTARQRELCDELAALPVFGRKDLFSAENVVTQRRWWQLKKEVREAERRARHLGRVQAALFKRSRRGMEIFSRLIVSPELTYRATAFANSIASPAK